MTGSRKRCSTALRSAGVSDRLLWTYNTERPLLRGQRKHTLIPSASVPANRQSGFHIGPHIHLPRKLTGRTKNFLSCNGCLTCKGIDTLRGHDTESATESPAYFPCDVAYRRGTPFPVCPWKENFGWSFPCTQGMTPRNHAGKRIGRFRVQNLLNSCIDPDVVAGGRRRLPRPPKKFRLCIYQNHELLGVLERIACIGQTMRRGQCTIRIQIREFHKMRNDIRKGRQP